MTTDVAVLFYKDSQNDKGLPDEWPAKVLELSATQNFPGPPWVKMSVSDYKTLIQQKRNLYDDWQNSNPDPVTPQQKSFDRIAALDPNSPIDPSDLPSLFQDFVRCIQSGKLS